MSFFLSSLFSCLIRRFAARLSTLKETCLSIVLPPLPKKPPELEIPTELNCAVLSSQGSSAWDCPAARSLKAADALQQTLKSRIGPERVRIGIHAKPKHSRCPFVYGAVQPPEGFVPLSQRGIDVGHGVRRNPRAAVRKQAIENPMRFVARSGCGIRPSQFR